MSTLRKNILITGASSGLGEEMARQFASMGRNLALCARRADRLGSLRQKLLAAYPNIRIHVKQLDVCDDGQVQEVFNSFAKELGQLDRVIINAGMVGGHSVGTGHAERNKLILTTNLVAALMQCEAAVEIFRKQNSGHLVTVSSVSATRGLPYTMTAYACSKAGLSNLTEGIRGDLLSTPINVTTLIPGFILSDLSVDLAKQKFVVSTEVGVRSMVKAMEREVVEAYCPAWPWSLLAVGMRHMSLRVLVSQTPSLR